MKELDLNLSPAPLYNECLLFNGLETNNLMSNNKSPQSIYLYFYDKLRDVSKTCDTILQSLTVFKMHWERINEHISKN